MNPQITLFTMLAVTLGAALYVAWPLLFGRVRPELYLDFEQEETGSGSDAERRSVPARTKRRATAGDSAVELDLEEEIEAFRRKNRTSAAPAASECPSCGRPVRDPEAAFCSKCGTPIDRSTGSHGRKSSKSRESR